MNDIEYLNWLWKEFYQKQKDETLAQTMPAYTYYTYIDNKTE